MRRRIVLATSGTLAGLAALVVAKSGGQPLAPLGGLPSATLTASDTPAGMPLATSHPGTYTGTAVTTRYGIVQARITVAGGRLTRVGFVELTGFDGHSQEINTGAGPTLLQETLVAQSARIDTVSGATYTSGGYRASLQAALDAARG